METCWSHFQSRQDFPQVVVQGLPFAYVDEDLRLMFGNIGGIVRADVVIGEDGRSKGYGAHLCCATCHVA